MRKTASLLVCFLTGTLLLLTSGCSTILRTEYYAPSAKGSVLESNYYPDEVNWGGKKKYLHIKDERFSVDCSIRNINEDLVSIGPSFILPFPIIPVFPINWFINDDAQSIIVEIRINGDEMDLNINWRKNIIITESGHSILPTSVRFIGGPDWTPTDSLGEVSLSLPSTPYSRRDNGVHSSIYFLYDLDVKEHELLTLQLDGIEILDSSFTIPQINLQKDRGWLLNWGNIL